MKHAIPRGRPRSDKAQRAILKAALGLVAEIGFRALTMEAIAAQAGVGKMTIYRWWPNKAAVVMDAFLTLVGPGSAFPEAPTALISIKLQMRLQARFFQSNLGRTIKALLGEAQFDVELSEAFRERWIMPRRRLTKEVLGVAIQRGEVRANIDIEMAIDMLYAPIYYRFLLGTGAINDAYTDGLFEQVAKGLRVE